MQETGENRVLQETKPIFQFPVTFAITNKIAEKLNPRPLGVRGEGVVKGSVALSDISYVFVPQTQVEYMRRLLWIHGHAHMQVLPF